MRLSRWLLAGCLGWAGASAFAAEPQQADIDLDPVAAAASFDAQAARAASNAERASLLSQEAQALSRQGRAEEAVRLLDRADGLLGPQDDRVRAGILLSRHQLLFDAQDYAAALEPLAKARAIWAAKAGEDSFEVANADARRALTLFSLSKFGDGLPIGERAWKVAERLRPAGDPERLEVGLAYAIGLSRSRHAAEAEALLRQLAEEGRMQPAGHRLRINAVVTLGVELVYQGRLNEAIPVLREGVDAGNVAKGVPSGEKANALAVMGSALLNSDRPADALPFLLRAAEMFGEAGLIPAQASANIAAGGAADRSGDRPRGLALREKGIALLATLPRQSELGLALNRFKLAQSYVHAGRLEEAEKLAGQAADVLTRLRPETHFQNTNSRISLGWIKTRRGRTAEGLAEVKAAFRTSVEANERVEAAQNQVVGVLDNIEAYSQALDTAILGHDRDFAFEVMQVLVETDASRAAVAVAAREQAGTSALGALLRERQEAAGKLVDANAARIKLAMAQAAAADVAAAEARLETARQSLAAIDARLDADFPGFRDLLRPRRVELADVQKRLTPGEVLLVVEESDLGLVTMAVTGKDMAIGHSPLRREDLRALVRRLREGTDAGGAIPFDLDAAAALHDAIFTPEVRRLARPGTRLRIASGDILSAVPFSLLISRRGGAAAGPRWLIEDHAVSVVPSLAAMRDAAAVPRSAGRLVAIGAPELAGTLALAAGPSYFDAGATRAANVAAMAPLPGAAREIGEMARLLGGKGPAPVILQGRAASEPAVRGLDFSHVGVLLFATHGLVAGSFDARSEPALVLTPPADRTHEDPSDDGLLTASEAATLRIDADWVILSACNTAAGDAGSAAGYTGLARAFLFAGARRVVASHWPVRDDVAARLSAGIVAAANRGLPPDEALRRAILSVLRDRHLPEAGHPALWAPYMVIAR